MKAKNSLEQIVKYGLKEERKKEGPVERFQAKEPQEKARCPSIQQKTSGHLMAGKVPTDGPIPRSKQQGLLDSIPVVHSYSV